MEPIQPCLHFDIHKPVLGRHYDIQDSERNIKAYTAEISVFSIGKPDLTLIQGSSRNSRSMVAATHFKKLGRTIRIGLGNTEHAPSHVRWEDMKAERAMKIFHVWSLTLPDGSKRSFAWKKTSHHHADGERGGLLSTNYKLVDMTGGGGNNIVAVCTTSGTFTEHAKLQIYQDLGPDFQVMVLMTFISIYEVLRRARAAARSASDLTFSSGET
ncbi:unnamed protein product [Clonostachys rosea]|uniref:Uncharacterized protein n=1 Tax=Bionectria ochroleuca TaxID=29856 RepID=A0ABY6UNY8_BIOOC|nr:unnamed protein product [Clonostachys rosea]